MVDNSANSPLPVKIQIIFINLGFLSPVEDGQDMRRTLATLV